MDFWPSKRVSQGGVFHTAKVAYSKETHDLIKCNFYNRSDNLNDFSSTFYYCNKYINPLSADGRAENDNVSAEQS